MISWIKVKIKEKEIELTKEEAIELKQDLDKLFSGNDIKHVPYPSPYPVYPQIFNTF